MVSCASFHFSKEHWLTCASGWVTRCHITMTPLSPDIGRTLNENNASHEQGYPIGEAMLCMSAVSRVVFLLIAIQVFGAEGSHVFDD